MRSSILSGHACMPTCVHVLWVHAQNTFQDSLTYNLVCIKPQGRVHAEKKKGGGEGYSCPLSRSHIAGGGLCLIGRNLGMDSMAQWQLPPFSSAGRRASCSLKRTLFVGQMEIFLIKNLCLVWYLRANENQTVVQQIGFCILLHGRGTGSIQSCGFFITVRIRQVCFLGS